VRGDVFKDATCGVTKKGKKDRNFHASKLLVAQTTHVDMAI